MNLSVVIPIYNESSNLRRLYQRLTNALDAISKDIVNNYEIVFVDDGSTDESFSILEDLHNDGNVKVIKLDRNYGQPAAQLTGISNSKGDYIIVMDADLQNDPYDIPKLIEKTKEGFSIVRGRRIRRNASLSRKIYSFIANKILRFIINKNINDFGCSFGIYNKEVFSTLLNNDNTLKYILLRTLMGNHKIIEVPVADFKREGSSRYGFFKLFKFFIDLIIIFVFHKDFTKIHSNKNRQPFFHIEKILS